MSHKEIICNLIIFKMMNTNVIQIRIWSYNNHEKFLSFYLIQFYKNLIIKNQANYMNNLKIFYFLIFLNFRWSIFDLITDNELINFKSLIVINTNTIKNWNDFLSLYWNNLFIYFWSIVLIIRSKVV